MVFSWKRTAQATMLGLGLLGTAGNRAEADLIVSYEAAGVQASTVSGVTTENFDEAPAGKYSNLNGVSSAIGTFTSPGIAIVAANVYGGAGGSGNYFAIGAESGTTSATLTFNGAESYFGFWWSAADANNGVDFYSGGKLLGSFSAATALASLSSAYNGNPNSSQSGDTGEKFAYLDFTGTNGTTFDQVVFRNLSTGPGSRPTTSASGALRWHASGHDHHRRDGRPRAVVAGHGVDRRPDRCRDLGPEPQRSAARA